jgi:hypothetical protein
VRRCAACLACSWLKRRKAGEQRRLFNDWARNKPVEAKEAHLHALDGITALFCDFGSSNAARVQCKPQEGVGRLADNSKPHACTCQSVAVRACAHASCAAPAMHSRICRWPPDQLLVDLCLRAQHALLVLFKQLQLLPLADLPHWHMHRGHLQQAGRTQAGSMPERLAGWLVQRCRNTFCKSATALL